MYGLADQHFHSYQEAKNWADSWIASKDNEFLRCNIHMLPERWEKVLASDGNILMNEYVYFFVMTFHYNKTILEINSHSQYIYIYMKISI